MSSTEIASAVGQAASKVGQAQQHVKERQGHYFRAPMQKFKLFGAFGGSNSSSEAMPEWKLQSLCSEYGLPCNVRGHLPMGGCF